MIFNVLLSIVTRFVMTLSHIEYLTLNSVSSSLIDFVYVPQNHQVMNPKFQ